MGLDVKTLAAAKSHTKKSLEGAGAVQGLPGKDGIGISIINKISTKGLIDTYQITLTNGSKYTFTITNGQDGNSPSISVGENSNWIINGVDTGVSAKGIKGDTGTGFKIAKQYNSITEMMSDMNPVEESVMVVVIENDTGFLYLRLPSYIDPDEKTNGYLPFGSLSDVSTVKGETGNDGITPHIDPITKHWFLGTSDTGIKATGENGADGDNGITPHIDGTSKHWMIGDADTGIVAEGIQGEKGESGETPHIGNNGNWWFGDTDSGIPIPVVDDLLEYADKNEGITDTPIGHIISIMSNSAPEHYLVCDGTEYNITDYPHLAKHFTDEFDKVNYFGGDGVTTFAVPDLRGEFLRGSGTAIRNTGSGAAVGVHQEPTLYKGIWADKDGRELNVYFASDTSNNVFRNIDKAVEQSIYSYTVTPSREGSNSSNNATVTTRPTNTSVLYCIKYEPTYFITVNNNTNFIDFTNQIQASGGVTLGEKHGYVQNNMVSIYLNVTFPSAGGKTFAKIPKEFAPKIKTMGMSYAEIDVADVSKVTYAAIYNNGDIYCFVNKSLIGSYTFQFIYPLNT